MKAEETAAFPASRLRFEFPKGSACACISGHGSVVQSVSSELSSKGFGQSLQGRLGVREVELCLIHRRHPSPEQRGSASVTMSPSLSWRRKWAAALVETCVFCKTAGSLLPPSASLVSLGSAPSLCHLPLATAFPNFSVPKLLQRHHNSEVAFPK